MRVLLLPSIGVVGNAMKSSFEQRLDQALEALRAAAPEAISFAELKALGVEKPAQVIYELELAGYPIEHGRAAVRLDDSRPGGGKP